MIVNRPLLCPNAGGSAKMGTQNADFCIFTRNAYCVALGSIVAHSVCLQDNISSPEEYMGCYQPFWGVRRYDTWVYIVLYIYMVYAHAWKYLIWNYTWYIIFGYICFAHKYTQVMYNSILRKKMCSQNDTCSCLFRRLFAHRHWHPKIMSSVWFHNWAQNCF